MKVSWNSFQWFKRSCGYKMCTPLWHTYVCIAKSMLCHGKPQISIWSNYKIGGAQLHDKTKILWKFHEIPSSGSGGVADTKVVTDGRTDGRTDIPITIYHPLQSGGYKYKKNLSILEGVRQEDFLFQSLRLLKNLLFRVFRLLKKNQKLIYLGRNSTRKWF